jgi:hypothetical protein
MREQACSMASMEAWSCCGSGLPPGKLCMAAAAAPDHSWRVVGSLRSPRVWPPVSGHPARHGGVSEGTEAAVEAEGEWMGTGWFRYDLLPSAEVERRRVFFGE